MKMPVDPEVQDDGEENEQGEQTRPKHISEISLMRTGKRYSARITKTQKNISGRKLKMASYKPTAGMKTEAQKGLDWRREHGRGGTAVGISRARDIVNGKNLSESTVKRMYSFFSRHEVDKQGEGFTPDEKGFPSNGRIAWALWGGDAGFSWSKTIVERLKKEDDRQLDRQASAKIKKSLQIKPMNTMKNMVKMLKERPMLAPSEGLYAGSQAHIKAILISKTNSKNT